MNRNNFLQFKISHRNWEESIHLLFVLLTTVSPGEVIVLTGPSRSGKSRLIRFVLDMMFPDPTSFDAGKKPYVYVRASNTGPNGTFSTKDFADRILKALDHPFYGSSHEDPDEIAAFKDKKHNLLTESRMWSALEKGFIKREVMYFVIDEGHHARYVTKNAMGSFAVLDSWKCFAENTNSVLVLVAAYPILDILQNSPHLLGRKYQVHLQRYHETEADLKEFMGIVMAYELALNQQGISGSVTPYFKDLYSGSFGCIGLLRKWILNLYAIAKSSHQEINKNLIERSRPSISELNEIWNEIEFGEKMLESERLSNPQKAKPSAKTDPKPKPKQKKPFQRNPKRLSPGNRNE